MVLKMAHLILAIALFVGCADVQEAIMGSGGPDMDAIYAEHAQWVKDNFTNDDWDEDLYEYHIKGPVYALADRTMLGTFEATRECVLNEFPEVVDEGWYYPTSFFEIKWIVFEEGWFLNESTHQGIQIAGVVWAGHIIGLDDEFVDDGETIVHEIIHVFVPGLGHNELYVQILRKCKPIVWPEELPQAGQTRGRFPFDKGSASRSPFDVRNP
jgi:hypothetical protein